MSDRITEIIDSQFSDITSYKTPEEQSPLYIAIAEKYNDITGETLPEESYEENCAKIWKWYYNKYSYPDMARGHGLSRSVSRTTPETEYHFDIPYQLPQFTADILGYIRFYTITVNQFVVQEFIKHICVAFKLDKYTCNDCLTAYGYLPLHSKNLHDLAVYSVLSTTENCEADINPLSLVKERYLKALDLLRGSSGMPTPHKTISTSLLTGEIEKDKIFDEEHFLSYVKKNAAYLNWRHSAILKEHSRLVKVFQYLYDKQQKGADWSKEEARYSLFSFINSFCKKIDHRHFAERLIKDVQNDGKDYNRANRHPTREIMIIPWLYEEFFRGNPAIICPKSYERAISNFCYKTFDEYGEVKIKFDIQKYLFGDMTASIKSTVKIGGNTYSADPYFNGSNVKEMINSKLSRYGYSILSTQSSYFDRIIIKLLSLKIYKASPRVQNPETGYLDHITSYYCEFGGSRPINLSECRATMIEDCETNNIPISLALVFDILNRVDELNSYMSGTTEEEANYILSCSLSSQV